MLGTTIRPVVCRFEKKRTTFGAIKGRQGGTEEGKRRKVSIVKSVFLSNPQMSNDLIYHRHQCTLFLDPDSFVKREDTQLLLSYSSS